jgi:hypothetical protein
MPVDFGHELALRRLSEQREVIGHRRLQLALSLDLLRRRTVGIFCSELYISASVHFVVGVEHVPVAPMVFAMRLKNLSLGVNRERGVTRP